MWNRHEIDAIYADVKATLAEVQQILVLLRRPRPTRIALELPAIYRKGVKMANFELKNDQIAVVTIKTANGQGATEPYPAGAVFTASVSDPTLLNAVIGVDAGGNPAVILNALVAAAANQVLTINGNDGLASVTQIVDIVADNTPTNIVLDLADATFTSQPVPTAPGPG